MEKILFICHGNICRSPMAEFVMKDIVAKKGFHDKIYVESAATSTEELGNKVHPGTRRKLAEYGITTEGKTARQVTKKDYDTFDHLIVMDENNVRNLKRIIGGDPNGKVKKLLFFAEREGDIADPWYTGNFDLTYDDVISGCEGLLEYLLRKEKNE